MPDFTADQIGTLAERIAIRVHGYQPETAPVALLGYAAALKAACAACATALPDLCRAQPPALFAALSSIARNGLVPGAAGDKTATAYLYLQNRAVVGKPNPLGRVRMAAAAGVDVSTFAVGRADSLELNEDGDVIGLSADLDKRPTTWADLRGVIVTICAASGVVRRVWVSAGEIEVRKRRSSSGDKGPWATDPVGMARSKALSIAVDRGDVPQAPVSVVPMLGAHPIAPVAVPVAPVAALVAAPEPTPEPEAAPPEAEPAAPEATAEDATPWGAVLARIADELQGDEGDRNTAAQGAITEALAKAPHLAPDALSDAAFARLVALARERLALL
jgi:hypothetical protein